MNKDQINSLIRHIISLVAGILLSRGIVEAGLLQSIIGILTLGVSVYWSIREKTFGLGQIEGTVRQVLTFISGFLAFRGYLNPDNIELWVATIAAILPAILGQTDKLWSDSSVPKAEEGTTKTFIAGK